ncbi:PucR family transcriptional regulator [Nocardioides aurantiacus]|uniref:PucR family transcriptional regulator n=1 Tax=Nocardioides aurantiacus TaxID=86796 RepID=UPI0014771FD6|nr:helix-turn-helix domain-containing protein [Nocardioides aurantiacus]
MISGGASRDPVLRAQVARAWALLLPRSDEVADAISDRLFEEDVEGYERLTPELRVEVRQSTRVHLRRGLEVLAEEDVAGGATVELWRETGRTRARQGVPMELVLNAYTMGSRVLWQALIETAADTAISETVLIEAGQAVWAALDVQYAVMIDGYREESRRLRRRDLQRQQSTLDALVAGRGGDPEFGAEVRTVLGLGVDAAIACVVALYDGALDEPLTAADDQLARLGVTSFWHVRTGVYFGLLAGPVLREPALVELFSSHARGRVGVAASPDGLAGFATAFQLATRAAETLPRGERRVVSVSDRLPEVLLAGSPEVLPLLRSQTLDPLLAQPEHHRRTLLRTLAAVLRHDGSAKHAAEELYCHRNTVIYRTKQIEQLTGCTLTDPRDKLMLELALMTVEPDPGRAEET